MNADLPHKIDAVKLKAIWAEALILGGFKELSGKTSGRNFLWRLTRKTRDKTDVVDIHFSKQFFGFQVQTISAKIIFHRVEDILKPLFAAYKVPNSNPHTLMMPQPYQDLRVYNQLKAYEITSDSDAALVAGWIKLFIDQNIMRFFDRHETVLHSAALFRDKTPRELVSTIRQPLPHRLLVIKRLESEAGYESYKKGLLEILNKSEGLVVDPNNPKTIYGSLLKALTEVEPLPDGKISTAEYKDYLEKPLSIEAKPKGSYSLEWSALTDVIDKIQTASRHASGATEMKAILKRVEGGSVTLIQNSERFEDISIEQLQSRIDIYDKTIRLESFCD